MTTIIQLAQTEIIHIINLTELNATLLSCFYHIYICFYCSTSFIFSCSISSYSNCTDPITWRHYKTYIWNMYLCGSHDEMIPPMSSVSCYRLTHTHKHRLLSIIGRQLFSYIGPPIFAHFTVYCGAFNSPTNYNKFLIDWPSLTREWYDEEIRQSVWNLLMRAESSNRDRDNNGIPS